MPLNSRILRVTLVMPNGQVVLNQFLRLNVKIRKSALSIQNKATIDVTGLTTQLRESLLSQFTAWNKRKAQTTASEHKWIKVKIEAGYEIGGKDQSSVIYVGEVVLVEPTSPPPNIGVRITCYTRQIDRTSFISDRAPARTTLLGYVKWAADQMGFGNNFICDTSQNDRAVDNPSRSMMVQSTILLDIQSMYRPDVVAYVDDDLLIIKDRDKVIDRGSIPIVDSFIGTPMWAEWGVEFTTMFNPAILVGRGVELKSKMNGSLNGQFVIMQLEYDLNSRDRAFYVKVSGSPPS